MRLTRRRLLAGTAGVAGTGFAGCIDDGSSVGSESAGATGASSFFVFGDIAAQVAGESANANLLVPIGQHGHGWEPGPNVRQDIRTADLFVHGGTGFQPWVDDILGDLEADNADVTTIDVSSGLSLLEAGGGHDHGHEEEEHHEEEGHDDYAEEEHHEEEGHDDHGAMDPHFWMDPLRVKEAVGTVRQAFADIDPDNAEAYRTNAESYRSDLDDLHQQLASVVDTGSKEVILLAGHDALQYFGERYGVRVESLTNVSPDDRPTLRDIERAQGIITTHDLQYICADPLESQQAAEQLVEETDATEVLPLTSMPGLTDEWGEKDWGYVEVMENVNSPTLERALDA